MHVYVLIQTRSWRSLISDSSSPDIAATDLRQSFMATAYDAVWALALSAHQSHTHNGDLNEDFLALSFRGTSVSNSST